eukprot:scaffold1297_cov368-Prasinococcus_capsulatus_cf.AAC.11
MRVPRVHCSGGSEGRQEVPWGQVRHLGCGMRAVLPLLWDASFCKPQHSAALSQHPERKRHVAHRLEYRADRSAPPHICAEPRTTLEHPSDT